jgi:DNA-binding transcriptional LysR family regulator
MVVLPIPRVDVEVRTLRRQNALCAVPKKHPLAGQDVVRIEDLVDEPLIAPVANTPFRVIFDRALKGLGRELDIRFEVRTQHGICAFVDAAAGVGLVDPCAARDWAGSEIIFLPCTPAIHWDIALITPKARPTTLITQAFIDFLLRNTEAYFATV